MLRNERFFPIPDPGLARSRIRIRFKEFNYFNSKKLYFNYFNSKKLYQVLKNNIRDVQPGSRILDQDFPILDHPGDKKHTVQFGPLKLYLQDIFDFLACLH